MTRTTQSEKEMKQELNQLLADQTRLQRLHDQLQSDYDRLSTERDDLKISERTLRMEISKLKDSAETVSQGQDDIIKAKEAIDMERENLKMDKKTLSNLRSEHSRLKDDFRYNISVKFSRNSDKISCSNFWKCFVLSKTVCIFLILIITGWFASLCFIFQIFFRLMMTFSQPE